MRYAPLIVACACGDNAAITDASARDTTLAACTLALAGNFDATITAPASCATVSLGSGAALGHRVLAFAFPLDALHATLAMSFDLGAAAPPGLYTSETTLTWSARAVQTFGSTICVYSAGSSFAPQGRFTLALDAIDVAAGAARGSLDMTLNVLTRPELACGPFDTEHAQVSF